MRVVSIDGPAGAGKSTIARRLANDLGWAYLDTGAMYRAVTVLALRGRIPLDDVEALKALADGLDLRLSRDGTLTVDGEDLTDSIRTAAVTAAVSTVAAVPAVRGVMMRHQRRFAHDNEDVVAEGRDIGTVVFPDAVLKVWLNAHPRERAQRRLKDPAAQPDTRDRPPSVEGVQAQLEARDRRDAGRAIAPLRPPDGAWRLDTTGMTLDEVFAAVRSRVQSVV